MIRITAETSSFEWDGYTYDADNRLTQTEEYGGGGCTTRAYAFGNTTAGKASDRTLLTLYNPNTDGTCQHTAPAGSPSTWTYDTADRITNTGYVYDSLGRTTTVPTTDTQAPDGGDLTVTYNVNDLVHTIQQGAKTPESYVLDVDNQRIRSWSTDGGTTSSVNHYTDGSDSPAWTSGPGISIRNISGLDGLDAIDDGLGIEWQMSNLQGSIVATTATGLTFDTTSTSDEYGNMENSAQAGVDRYGWLGTKERAADNPGGIVLMGVRLYNSVTGRFLSVDPVAGGSCNRYDYTCQDPTNGLDLDGKRFCTFGVCFHFRKAWHKAEPKLHSGVEKILHAFHPKKRHWYKVWSKKHRRINACIWGGIIGGLAVEVLWKIFGKALIIGCIASYLFTYQ